MKVCRTPSHDTYASNMFRHSPSICSAIHGTAVASRAATARSRWIDSGVARWSSCCGVNARAPVGMVAVFYQTVGSLARPVVPSRADVRMPLVALISHDLDADDPRAFELRDHLTPLEARRVIAGPQ